MRFKSLRKSKQFRDPTEIAKPAFNKSKFVGQSSDFGVRPFYQTNEREKMNSSLLVRMATTGFDLFSYQISALYGFKHSHIYIECSNAILMLFFEYVADRDL